MTTSQKIASAILTIFFFGALIGALIYVADRSSQQSGNNISLGANRAKIPTSKQEPAIHEQQIAAKAESLSQDFIEGDKQPTEDLNYEGGDAEELLYSYRVSNGQLRDPEPGDASALYGELQQDTENHQLLWSYFVSLFPLDRLSMISELELFSDGPGGTEAALYQSTQDPTMWILAIDLEDAFYNTDLNVNEMTYIFLHEFGHLLTLNAEQIQVNRNEINALSATRSDSEYDRLFHRYRSQCLQFYVPEGCSHDSSYLNLFFQRFWTALFLENERIEAIPDDQDYLDAVDAFYIRYRDQFVTSYAATNPGEDIAETWAVFVLQDRPAGDSIRDQKVQFFYEFPELVELRDSIRSQL